MDEIAVVLKRFGDEQSTLLDQFERLSFEVHLSQAMLGRSLSEPGASRSQFKGQASGAAPLAAQVKQGSRRRGLGGGGGGAAAGMADPKDPRSWKAFSRSLRI
ncbi:Protein Wnt-3a [Salix suchowensis]|nr:Protein Wnt-3a [Salix suchowensis]